MKRLLAHAIAVALSIFFVTACSTIAPPLVGSGRAQTEQRTVSDFTKASIDDAIVATIIVGPAVTIAVTADDNVLAKVTTTVVAGKLSVDIDGTAMSRTPVTVAITVPALDDVEAATAAKLTVTGLNADNFSAAARSAATVVIRGNANSVVVKADTAATADLGGVAAQTATVSASSAARATVNAQLSVSGSVDSAAVVTVEGNPPSVNVATSSGGVVVRD
jgi:hypothetical protein